MYSIIIGSLSMTGKCILKHIGEADVYRSYEI